MASTPELESQESLAFSTCHRSCCLALRPQPPGSGPRARSDSRLLSRSPARLRQTAGHGMSAREESPRRGFQELDAEFPSHQFVIDRAEAREWLFKSVASPEPAEHLLVDVLGELAYRPDDAVRFLRYTLSGESKEGGDRGHQDSEANEDGPGNRKGAQERDLGLPETSAGGYAGSSPNSSKRKATSKRTRVTRVN